MKPYTSQLFTAQLPLKEYMARFLTTDRAMKGCKHCPNAHNRWSCPPFEFDTIAFLRNWQYVTIIVDRITPCVGCSLNSTEIITEERIPLERKLIGMEPVYDGRAFTLVGGCNLCGDMACTRPEGKPCRHPDRLRPTLSSFGFDMRRTLNELFGMDLQFGSGGKLPEQLSLVVGFLHNLPIGKTDFLTEHDGR